MLHKFSNNPNQPSYCNQNNQAQVHHHQIKRVNVLRCFFYLSIFWDSDPLIVEYSHFVRFYFMRICWNICASQLSPTTVSRACFTLELPVWSGIIITCATESLLQLLQLDDKHKILSFSQKRRKTWPNQQLKVNVVAVVTFVVSSILLLLLLLAVVFLLLLSMLLLFCSWLCVPISCNLLWIEACCPQWPGWLLIAYLLLIHPGPQVRVLKPQVHQFSNTTSATTTVQPLRQALWENIWQRF